LRITLKPPSGRYLIKNAQSGNLAVLADDNYATDLRSAIPGLEDDLEGEKVCGRMSAWSRCAHFEPVYSSGALFSSALSMVTGTRYKTALLEAMRILLISLAKVNQFKGKRKQGNGSSKGRVDLGSTCKS